MIYSLIQALVLLVICFCILIDFIDLLHIFMSLLNFYVTLFSQRPLMHCAFSCCVTWSSSIVGWIKERELKSSFRIFRASATHPNSLIMVRDTVSNWNQEKKLCCNVLLTGSPVLSRFTFVVVSMGAIVWTAVNFTALRPTSGRWSPPWKSPGKESASLRTQDASLL